MYLTLNHVKHYSKPLLHSHDLFAVNAYIIVGLALIYKHDKSRSQYMYIAFQWSIKL